ncbi:MAG: hypothetical protein KKC38_02255 [Nanoarchaeota archaeon]|nr:hypothetical protein [Nanoarchaeota archaeon]
MNNKIIYCTLNMFVIALVGFIFYFFAPPFYRYVGFVIALVGYIILHRKFSQFEFWKSYLYSLIIYLVFFLLFFYVNRIL